MELTKLHRERAVDAVYQALRQAILSNGLKPGERLNVDELARKLGVSLTPIRGAIQQLATEGLVQIRPRSGTFVTSLSQADIDDTFSIRIALECLAAESAVSRIDPAGLSLMRDLSHLMRKPIRTRDDWEAHEKNNGEFHLLFVRAGGNRRLAEMYQSVEAQNKIALMRVPESVWTARLNDEFAEHQAIIDGLARGDVPFLCSTLKNHINHARAIALTTVNDRAELEPQRSAAG
jgi:DNA-binding GntR family transcriptional regulator